MYVPLDSLYALPFYQTQSEYRARTGKEPPPHDQRRPLQHWEDPDAGADGSLFVTYDHVLQRINGRWQIAPMTVPTVWASSVNLPPEQSLLPEGSIAETLPVPLVRGLRDDEELVIGFGGLPRIRNRSEYMKLLEDAEQFTAADRALLRAIAEKVGAI